MRVSIIIIFIVFFHPLLAQRRVIVYGNLTDIRNYPFNRPRQEIYPFLSQGAQANQLTLYRFSSFKKAPKVWSWTQYETELNRLDNARFKPYQPGKTYAKGDEVSFSDAHFRSLADNNTVDPGTYYGPGSPTLWVWASPEEQVLGLDIFIDSKGDSSVQYLHFYTPDFQYEISFRAKEAIDYLNSTRNLWFTVENHFLNQLAGDVFLFGSEDDKPFLDLGSQIDSVKLRIPKESFEVIQRLGLLRRLKDGHLMELVLTEEGNSAAIEVLDTIPVSEIRKNLSNEKAKIFRLGDAIIAPSLFKISSGYPPLTLSPLKDNQNKSTIQKVDTFAYSTVETFWFDLQSAAGSSFSKNVNALINRIYEGVANKSITVFASDTLDRVLTPDQMIDRWTMEDPHPQQWVANKPYMYEQLVIYQGDVYSSVVSDSSSEPPSHRPEKWTRRTEGQEIFQPEDAKRITFRYEIIATASGQIIRKEPISIGLEVKERENLKMIGYFKWAEIKKWILQKDAGLWKQVSPWMERQNGLYQTEFINGMRTHQ